MQLLVVLFALRAARPTHHGHLGAQLLQVLLRPANAYARYGCNVRREAARLAGLPRAREPRARQFGALGDVDAGSAANIAVNLALAGAMGSLLLQLRGEQQLYAEEDCLPGRSAPILAAPPLDARHVWLGRPLHPPFPDDTEMVMFGMGCFWCSENLFMRLPRGIHSTAVGYAGGVTPNPTYEEVCSGRTNHAEVVRVVYWPSEIRVEDLMKKFWEGHDPTTENRQGNDMGTPYRSAIYCYSEEQMTVAEKTRDQFQAILQQRGGYGRISTEIKLAGKFYYAEGFHQQYDARGNAGYCGLRPTGASFIELPVDMP